MALNRFLTRQNLIYASFVVLFGLVGMTVVILTRAATPTASVKVADGTVDGCASVLADTSASGGKAVKFAACGSDQGLDESGATIPDTNYAIPAGAIYMATTGSDSGSGSISSPVKTLNEAIGLVPSGGTIVARAGTYRDWYNDGSGHYKIATKGFTLQPYPHEKVWFDGTNVIASNSWTSDGSGHWYQTWNTPSFCDGAYYDFAYNNQSKSPSNLTGTSGKTYSSNSGPCSHWDVYGSSSANYPAAGDPQMVFVDGSRMQEVAALSDATGGKFYYDWANKRMYISTNPSGHTIELAARSNALVLGGGGTGYTLRGIGFKRYATNSYENLTDSAVYVGGNNPSRVENTVFTQDAGSGLSMGTVGSTIDSSVFAYNGYMGAHFYGHARTAGVTDNFVVQNSVFNHNNLENYDLNCSLSCGAAGFKMSAVQGYTFKNNIFENTQGPATGAWCDTACYNGKFVDNLVVNNETGYHYEQDSDAIIAGNLFLNNTYGINVSSDGAKIYNNTIVNSKTIAMRIYDDERGITTSDISLGNNVISGTSVNTNWFNGRAGSTLESNPAGWFTYYDYNSYWRPTNFTLYRLINATDQYYSSSTSFHSAYPSWEAHATDYVGSTDPFFVNAGAGDYTIRSGSAAYHSGGAIPSDVAAAMGTTTSSGQNRGALTYPGQ